MTAVIVSSGNDARPNIAAVLWVDTRAAGAARPVNMGATDLWFTAGTGA